MKRSILFAAIAIVAVAVLWLAFKPSGDAPQAGAGGNNAAPAAAVAPPAQQTAASPGVQAGGAGSAQAAVRHEVFELVVKNGKLTSGPTVMKVHEGEQVTLRITSDHSDELHLHGYNLRAALKPGETASLELAATRTGRFTLELHHADIELAALEVYPN
jgi:hypothetical protein